MLLEAKTTTYAVEGRERESVDDAGDGHSSIIDPQLMNQLQRATMARRELQAAAQDATQRKGEEIADISVSHLLYPSQSLPYLTIFHAERRGDARTM